MFVFLLSIALLLIALHYFFEYNAGRVFGIIPTPKGVFLCGNGIEILADPVNLFKLGRRYAKNFDGIYGWYTFMLTTINIYNPEDIETIISSSKYSEKSTIYNIIGPWLKEGLLVSKGSKWVHRRKILTPTFHFNILRRFVTVMEKNSQNLVKKLAQTAGESVDVVPVISEYTLNGICETAMGTRLDQEKSKEGNIYKESLQQVSRSCTERMARFYYIYEPIFNLSMIARNFYKHLKTITNFTKMIIKERKEYVEKNGINFSDSMEDDNDDIYLNSRKKKVAMLDLMISAEKEGVIDSAGIQEEVDTFMFEGHDTTAAGLDLCLMLIANHKSIQDKILKEINDTFGDSDHPATIDDLNALKYLECCIKESLRLYPPVPFIGRNINQPVVLSGQRMPAGVQCHIHIYDLHRNAKLYPDPEKFDPDRFLPENSVGRHPYAFIPFSAGPRNCIGGQRIPAGVQCHIHIYDLHRNAKLYPDPEKFDPDRFLPENSVGRHPYAFIPFSAGPRNCIGQRFAMLEMKSCISSIMRKFELHPVTTSSEIEMMADLVLRTSKPIYVKFVARK